MKDPFWHRHHLKTNKNLVKKKITVRRYIPYTASRCSSLVAVDVAPHCKRDRQRRYRYHVQR